MSSLDKNSVDRALEHFLRRILLTSTQHSRATSAIANIKTIIRNGDSCPSDASIFEQGSFATRTTLKPDTQRVATAEFDVDIAIESSQWSMNDPQSALIAVNAMLIEGGISPDRLTTKASCVRIDYADGPTGEKFHVDVVPIRNNGVRCYAAKCTDEDNEWIESDPGKLTRWFVAKANTELTFRAQYLLLKRFAQMNGIKIPSIAIQKIANDSYVFKSSESRYVRELLDMCRVAVQNLDDPDYELTNPVNPGEDIRKRLKDGELDRYRDLLASVVVAIERFSTDGTYADVAELFGDMFPKTESHEKELSLRSSGYYFDCDFADKVRLGATAGKGSVDGTNYTLSVDSDHKNTINRAPVDNIKFIAQVPQHHSVIWQVMNDPDEVPFQIRGNFESSNDPELYHSDTEHRSESISYAGNHFVRAFIIKGQQYKAVSDRFDVNVVRSVA